MAKTNLELVLQEIFLIGKLAIEAEKLLLLLGERLQYSLADYPPIHRVSSYADVDFVFLMGIHDVTMCSTVNPQLEWLVWM